MAYPATRPSGRELDIEREIPRKFVQVDPERDRTLRRGLAHDGVGMNVRAICENQDAFTHRTSAKDPRARVPCVAGLSAGRAVIAAVRGDILKDQGVR